jgi:hypothetical protein
MCLIALVGLLWIVEGNGVCVMNLRSNTNYLAK